MSQTHPLPHGIEPDEWWLPHIESWGVPDWRDASAYPEPGEISMSAWAWEFLRRNSDYRLAWLEVAAPREGNRPSPYRADPRRFGLRGFVDPRKSNAGPRFVSSKAEIVLHFGPTRISCSAKELAIVVDLTRPVGAQLKEAAAKLKNLVAAPRLRETMFPKYLRVLDAVDELRTFDKRGRERSGTSKIGRVLAGNFDDPKTQSIYVNRWRAEAESYRDGGYYRRIIARDR